MRCVSPRWIVGCLSFPRDDLGKNYAALFKVSPLVLGHDLEIGSQEHVKAKRRKAALLNVPG